MLEPDEIQFYKRKAIGNMNAARFAINALVSEGNLSTAELETAVICRSFLLRMAEQFHKEQKNLRG